METAADTKSIAYPLESPELRRKPKLSCGDGYTTPRSIKTLKRLQKLQDAPSLTNSLDFTGTNDCTPKQQKKCRGRDCTPEMPEKEDHKLVPDKEPQQESLQSAFTTLLNQSDSMRKSSFQLLTQASENAARCALQRLDLVSDPHASMRTVEAGCNQRDRMYQAVQLLVRLYFFAFNQRSETLLKLFVSARRTPPIFRARNARLRSWERIRAGCSTPFR